MSSTDLVDFRNQFLAKTEARLNALDIAAASDTDLLLNSALLKAYGAVNDFDVISINALSFLSNKTGAQLETALQDPSNRVRFDEIVASTSAMTAIVASATAMTTISGSITAMKAMVASSAWLAGMSASNSAMTAIWASNTATDVMIESAAARQAIYDSVFALSALQATPTQVQRLITNGGASRVVSYSGSNTAAVIVANGTKLILLRRYYSSSTSTVDVFDWERGSTTSAIGQGPAAGGRNLDTGIVALGCQSGTYLSNGAAPVADDYTGNFVSAANGLQTRTAPGKSFYVKYILV